MCEVIEEVERRNRAARSKEERRKEKKMQNKTYRAETRHIARKRRHLGENNACKKWEDEREENENTKMHNTVKLERRTKKRPTRAHGWKARTDSSKESERKNILWTNNGILNNIKIGFSNKSRNSHESTILQQNKDNVGVQMMIHSSSSEMS